MKEFEYTHDKLVKVWERANFTIEAESEEEANIKATEIARSKDYPDFTEYERIEYEPDDDEEETYEELMIYPSEEIIWTNLIDK